MILWGSLAGGLVGTIVLTSGLRIAQEAGWTRMDLPRMGTHWTDADETPILEAPGFMLHNYGRATALVNVAVHLAYGTTVGAFAAGF